jgi:hypothetical protein
MNLTAISYISQTGDQAHTQPASLDRIFVGENAVFGSGQNHDTLACTSIVNLYIYYDPH